MAKTVKPAPAPTTGGTTSGTTGGTTPPVTPPATGLKDDFINGNKLRDRKDVVGTKYDVEIDAVNANQDDDIPAKSAALFDEQGMDPYEVNNAQ